MENEHCITLYKTHFIDTFLNETDLYKPYDGFKLIFRSKMIVHNLTCENDGKHVSKDVSNVLSD